MRIRSAARVTLPALILVASAHAATFTVDTTDDTVDATPGDGICADANASCSLRAAIQESNASAGADTVEIPAGVFALTTMGQGEDASATGDLDIADDTTLHGAGADATFIDAGALDRVVDVLAGAKPRSVHIEGVTIRSGFLADVTSEASGAGLRVADTVSLSLEDVVIRGNTTTHSLGGVAIDSAGCITGAHVRILDNRDTETTGSAFATGAVHLRAGTDACFVLDDSEISGNRADYAGAIYADATTVTLRRSLISDNEARFAGALLPNSGDTVLLENVTISGNRGDPGAILNDGGSTVTLVHCTVTGNGPSLSTANVGGIQDVHGGFGLTFLSNTIIYGNGPGFIADDCDRGTSVGGGNMIGDSARCHFDAQPSDQLDVDPELGPLADNGGFTWTHLPGSAAIDRAQPDACTPTDQRGLPRPVDGDGDGTAACDAGAVEVQPDDAIFADGFDA